MSLATISAMICSSADNAGDTCFFASRTDSVSLSCPSSVCPGPFLRTAVILRCSAIIFSAKSNLGISLFACTGVGGAASVFAAGLGPGCGSLTLVGTALFSGDGPGTAGPAGPFWPDCCVPGAGCVGVLNGGIISFARRTSALLCSEAALDCLLLSTLVTAITSFCYPYNVTGLSQ